MTPKEKANELFDKYNYELSNHIFNGTFDIAKECALIAVDEIIQQLTPIEKAPNNKSAFQYWNEVKQEIELL
jgi:hypothetical protein